MKLKQAFRVVLAGFALVPALHGAAFAGCDSEDIKDKARDLSQSARHLETFLEREYGYRDRVIEQAKELSDLAVELRKDARDDKNCNKLKKVYKKLRQAYYDVNSGVDQVLRQGHYPHRDFGRVVVIGNDRNRNDRDRTDRFPGRANDRFDRAQLLYYSRQVTTDYYRVSYEF